MSSKVIDLTMDVIFPEDIRQHWIPLDGLPVPHLFQFTQYPPPETLYYNHPVRATRLPHKRGQHVVDPTVYQPRVGQLRSKGSWERGEKGSSTVLSGVSTSGLTQRSVREEIT